MGAGVFIAFQMVFPELSFGIEWTTFGRLRPIHTSGVIFAFGGNVLLGASFLCPSKNMPSNNLFIKNCELYFFSFQIFLLLAVSGYVMGITQGKEYAEPEWYADILLTVIWLLYFICIFNDFKK